MSENTNILVVGIGGQGVMTATEILAEAAIAFGHDAKKTEVAGMAQRGGVVSSHLRFGKKVLSPQITPGTADVLLGFESAETMRWQHMLRPDGITLMNTATDDGWRNFSPADRVAMPEVALAIMALGTVRMLAVRGVALLASLNAIAQEARPIDSTWANRAATARSWDRFVLWVRLVLHQHVLSCPPS